MNAGRELDALVADNVMGELCNCDGGSRENRANPYGIPSFCPLHGIQPNGSLRHYSTDIRAAWLVVERMQRDGNMVSVNASSEDGLWWCCIYPFTGAFTETEAVESAPLAICLAALDAVKLYIPERDADTLEDSNASTLSSSN